MIDDKLKDVNIDREQLRVLGKSHDHEKDHKCRRSRDYLTGQEQLNYTPRLEGLKKFRGNYL